jgi:hypothetical protein
MWVLSLFRPSTWARLVGHYVSGGGFFGRANYSLLDQMGRDAGWRKGRKGRKRK